VHTERGIEPRHVVLRAMVAWDGSSYAVMPGGLTRVATGDRSLVVSMQLGGGSKDTWIVGREARDRSEPSPKAIVIDAGENATELASRVADNLYWLGRYTERVDAHARLLRALLPGISGESEFGRRGEVETTLHFLNGLGLILPSGTTRARHRRSLQRLLGQAVFDPAKVASVGWHITQIRRVSWEIKERLSHDAWRVLHQLESGFSGVKDRSGERRFLAATAQLDSVVIMLAAFAGLLAEHPTRGHGWRFLDMGRRLERALQMIELLRVGTQAPPILDDACLEVLLHVTDSANAYRSRYLTTVRSALVLELLLADESHPRSVAYQLTMLGTRIGELPSTDVSGLGSVESALASRLISMRRTVHVDEIAGDTPRARAALLEHLLSLKSGLQELSEALTARYLTHSSTSRLRSSS